MTRRRSSYYYEYYDLVPENATCMVYLPVGMAGCTEECATFSVPFYFYGYGYGGHYYAPSGGYYYDECSERS